MKVKIKGSILSLLLSLCLALSVPFSSLADLATDSQATYDIDYESIQPLSIGIAPMSTITSVTNTVNRSAVFGVLRYYDMSNVLKNVVVPVDSSGHVIIPRPSDYYKPFYWGVLIGKSSLPSSGNYRLQVDFASDTGLQYSSTSAGIYSYRDSNNVQQESYTTSVPFTSFSGDAYLNTVIDIGSVNNLYITFPVSTGYPPWGGYWNISFARTSDQSVINTPGTGTVGQDTQNAISDNTEKMAEEQEKTNGFLVEIIQTISNQLKAFWDQLAGEFTNLYNKMNQQHQEKLEADRNNTEDIISNQNDNTNQIVNGFDSSELDSSSNNLNDTLTEYDTLENSISESMGSYLEDFQYHNLSDYPSGVLGSVLFFGNYMQRIFESMNNFNLPITLGFTLTFVLMLIGYFRYGR